MIGYKLFADPADVANSSAVISYLFAGSNALSSTNVGGKEGLDVNVINPIEVDLDGVYDGVNNLTPDSAGLIAHSRAATPGAAQQIFRSTGGVANADAIVAANVHALDANAFGMVFNGTTWDRLLGTSGAAHVEIQNTILNTKQCYVAAALQTPVAVTTSAVQLATTPLTNRCKVLIQNKTNKDISLGFSNAVTVANGIQIPRGGFYEEILEAGVDIYVIGPAGVTGNAVVAEYASA